MDIYGATVVERHVPCRFCPTYPIPWAQKEISIYLSWDKDFKALAKQSIQFMIFIFMPRHSTNGEKGI